MVDRKFIIIFLISISLVLLGNKPIQNSVTDKYNDFQSNLSVVLPSELVGYTNTSEILLGDTVFLFIGGIDDNYQFISGLTLAIQHPQYTNIIATSSDLVIIPVLTNTSFVIGENIFNIRYGIDSTLDLTIKIIIANNPPFEGSNQISFVNSSNPIIVQTGNMNNIPTTLYSPNYIANSLGNYVAIYYPYNSNILLLGMIYIDLGFNYNSLFETELLVEIPSWINQGVSDNLLIELMNSSLYYRTYTMLAISILEQPWEYSLEPSILEFNRLSFGDVSDQIITLNISNTVNIQEVYYYLTLNISNYVYNLSESNLMSSHSFEVILDINFSIPLGEGILLFNFIRNNSVIEIIDTPILIYDYIDVTFKFENELQPDSFNRFEIYTFGEDNYQPIPANVVVEDSRTSKVILNLTTPSNGFVIDEIYFDQNFTTGDRYFFVTVSPVTNQSYYQGKMYPFYQTVYSNTRINLINPLLQVTRGEILSIKAQVISDNNESVPEGIVELYQYEILPENKLVLFNSTDLIEYELLINSNFLLGFRTLILTYSGSPNYRSSMLEYNFYVYGKPHFESIIINSSQLFVNDHLSITGRLILEDNQSVEDGETIQLWKILNNNGNTIKIYMEDILISQGEFRTIIFPESEIGILSFELTYDGSSERFYQASSAYRFDLSQSPQVTFSVPSIVSAGNITEIHVTGRIRGHYSISYQLISGNDEFHYLSDFYLNESGQISTQIRAPDLMGVITLQLTDLDLNTSLDKQIIIKVHPRCNYQINGDFINVESQIIINCNNHYAVYLDQFLISLPEINYTDTTYWNHTFSSVGNHILKIKFIHADYLFVDEITFNFLIYKSISVASHNLPETITEGSTVSLTVQFVDNFQFPISNMSVSLVSYNARIIEEKYETSILSAMTDESGKITVFPQFFGDENYIFYKFETNEDLFIKEALIPIHTKIIRMVYIDITENNYETFEGIPVQLDFLIKYQYTSNISVGLVKLSLSILENGNNLSTTLLESNNQGEFFTRIGQDLSPGIYLVSFSFSQDGFVPFTFTKELVIHNTSSIITNFNSVSLIGLILIILFSSTLILRKLQTKV